jgi:hypothetical protein
MPCGAKPQALWRSIYRDSLFPRTEYAEAWKVLQRDLPRRDACRRMVDLLFIAAKSLVNRPAKRSWHICCRQTSTQTSTQPEASSPQPGALASRLAPKVTALPTDVAVIKRNLHGDHAVSVVVGTESILIRGKLRTVEVRACPVTFSPAPQQIDAARHGYEDWWQALDWARDGLVAGRMLWEMEVMAVMPKVRPWGPR